MKKTLRFYYNNFLKITNTNKSGDMHMRHRQKGYLLPATIMLGLGIALMSGTFLKFTASSSETLNTQSYQSIAQEAARSGMAYADSCLQQSLQWSPSSPLQPNTDCTGTASGGSAYITQQGSEWRSTFSVAPADGNYVVVSTGTVQLLNNGSVVNTFTATAKMTLSGQYSSFPVSSGESITKIKNDKSDCAIANGKLYCWGQNDYGQVGDGTKTDRANPTLVGGALAGKTVTQISISDVSACAIADGLPYCWGDNGWHQLGNNSTSDKLVPTAGSPTVATGPLSGQFVPDIGTSAYNNPANLIWPFASAFQHSCAITADGAASCWGYGGFRQNTGGGIREICILICLPTPYFSYPSYDEPHLVVGNGYGPSDGKKAVRVGASSHDSCVVADGIMYCWGVPAPLYTGLQIACTLPIGLFSDADLTLVPFNACVGNYSNGYDATNAAFSQMAGKLLDPNTWDVSANEGCMMADTNFYCFGVTPAFGTFWIDSFQAPWNLISNSDVTDTDNGDNADSGGLIGLYCVVDRGDGKCAGQPLNGWTGTGTNGWKNMQPLIKTAAPNGLTGLTAMRIAAGYNHGCVVANGQLFCWGDGAGGRLANGSYSGYVGSATLSGRGGSTPIGTGTGQLAAHDSISTGTDHSCGVANGKAFCWGRNNYGQLGMGTNNDASQPQAVTSLTNTVTTRISAGGGHTCAVVKASLYCWGRNNYGQLGINNTNDQTTPQLVGGALAGKRVSDVSAGLNSTCAIANGDAYCWGNNGNQQLGQAAGDVTQRLVPTAVTGIAGKSITSISMGSSHACAAANSDLWCWGNNANGRTGLGTTTGNSTPTQVTGGTINSLKNTATSPDTYPVVSQVSAGGDFTCAVINSTVSCWGNNANGRTGLGTTTGNQTTPSAINGLAGTYFATSVSAGDGHACALIHGNNSATNGNIWCWGTGASGRLGNGATTDQASPVLVNGGDTLTTSSVRRVATQIAAGGSQSCAIANADILCWGEGLYGKLGTGVTVDKTRPAISASFRFVTPYARGPIF